MNICSSYPCRKMGKKVVKASKAPTKPVIKSVPVNNNNKRNTGNKGMKAFDSSESESDDSSSDSEVEVKFELFNMAESDYHSIKQYLGNCFGAGDHGVDLVGLTSFIVEGLAEHLGTCIKTDGESSDPFGFLAGFPISFARKGSKESLKSFETFISGKLSEIKDFFGDEKNVVMFQERLINVPGSIAAPLYRQFLDDWRLASIDEPVHFSEPRNVLIVTPTYREVVSKLDRELGLQEDPKKFGVASSETNFYYEEMEYLGEFASKSLDFAINSGHETSDSRRAFSENGIESGRRAFIVSWDNLGRFVNHLESLQE